MFHTFPIGGIVGISHDENMFHKWTITARLRTAVNTNLKLLTGLKEIVICGRTSVKKP